MTNTITPLRVKIKCFGKYTFRINDPAVFMSRIAGTAEIYRKAQVEEQIKTEVIAVFQNVVNELGTEAHKVPVLEMPSQTDEIREMMDEKVFDEKIRERGLIIESFAVESVSLDEESEKKIDDYELSSNAYMQQGKMISSYADAVKSAAANENGAMNGFMGIGMMNMSTGNAVNNMVGGAFTNTENSRIDLSNNPTTTDEPLKNEMEWECPKCKNKNTGFFCDQCGTKKPTKIKCDKCGWEPKGDLETKPKFCANCGDPFDENDNV